MTKTIAQGPGKHRTDAGPTTGRPKEGWARAVALACFVLALAAGVFYVLMGVGAMKVPALSAEEAPAAIAYVAGGCYVVGGVLVLVRKRWLRAVGLAANTLVIASFFVMYNQKPDIMFSLPGLTTKIAEVLLEVALIYLVIAATTSAAFARSTRVTASRSEASP